MNPNTTVEAETDLNLEVYRRHTEEGWRVRRVVVHRGANRESQIAPGREVIWNIFIRPTPPRLQERGFPWRMKNEGYRNTRFFLFLI